MTYDSIRGKTVLWGGLETVSQNYSQETWEWDGVHWTQVSTASAPPAQAYGAMVFDSARAVCVYYGNGQTWEYDGSNWQRFSGPSPSARYHHAMSYDSARGMTVMFGGSVTPSQGDALAETWEYDGTQWSQRSGSNPTPRSHHAMAYHAGTNRTILFGGQPPNNRGTIFLSDMWSWDGSSWTLTSSANRPPPKTTHGMAYHAGLDKVFLTGGWSGTAPGDSDTWAWDGNDWSLVTSTIPPFRRAWTGNQFTYDAQRNEMVLFCGCGPYPEDPDTWTFDGQDWTPKLGFRRFPFNRSLYATTPPMTWDAAQTFATQAGANLVTIRRQVENDWIWNEYGGRNLWIGLNDRTTEGSWVWSSGETSTYTNWRAGQPNGGTSQNVVAMRSGDGGTWSDETGSASYVALLETPFPGAGRVDEVYPFEITTTQTPPALTGTALAPLPQGGTLLFGGFGTNGPSYPTYELHGSQWSQSYSIVNPMPRIGHGLALDSTRGNNVMFGGENHAGSILGDTWTYLNGTWSYRAVSAQPSPRKGLSLTHDPQRRVSILFGGVDALGVALGDMWRWNGSNWTELTPAQRPSPRHSHKTAWDARRGRIVLFGGYSGSSYLGDVWEWDGSSWTEITPAQPAWFPEPRGDFGFAYDPRSEKVVLHGGETAGGCAEEYWTWDGVEWVLSYPDTPTPSARSTHDLFFDPALNELRLYGGGCDGNGTNDLWKVDLPVPHRVAQFGAGCQGTVATPSLGWAPTTQPVLGQTFTVDLTSLPPSPANIPFIIVGFSKTEWAGGTLPVNLAIIGMPGCQLLTSSEDVTTLPNLGGRATISFGIPNETSLLGVSTFFQGAVTDRFANIQGLVVSNGLEIYIGDR